MNSDKISGSFFLEIKDQFKFASFAMRNGWRRLIFRFVFISVLFCTATLLTENGRSVYEYTSEELLDHVVDIFITSLPILISLFLVSVLLVYISVPISLLRLGRDRRLLTVEADASGVRTRDALGTELYVPWSSVKRTVSWKTMLFFQLKRSVWRFVPLRAFAPEAQAVLQEWAKNVGAAKS